MTIVIKTTGDPLINTLRIRITKSIANRDRRHITTISSYCSL